MSRYVNKCFPKKAWVTITCTRFVGKGQWKHPKVKIYCHKAGFTAWRNYHGIKDRPGGRIYFRGQETLSGPRYFKDLFLWYEYPLCPEDRDRLHYQFTKLFG